jgi:hypothetical protein
MMDYEYLASDYPEILNFNQYSHEKEKFIVKAAMNAGQ